MDAHFGYYVFCIVALIVGIVVVKKVAGCMIRSIVVLALLAALAAVYFLFFK